MDSILHVTVTIQFATKTTSSKHDHIGDLCIVDCIQAGDLMLPTSECWTLAQLEFRKNLHTLGKERRFTYKLHSAEERVSDDQTQNRQQTPNTCGLVRRQLMEPAIPAIPVTVTLPLFSYNKQRQKLSMAYNICI